MPESDLISIQSFVKNGFGYVYLAGRLVAETRFDFKQVLREIVVVGNARQIIISLGALEYIDSAGLAALIGGWKSVKENGGEAVVAELSDSLRAIFEVSSLHQFFTIFPSVDSATAYFAGKAVGSGQSG